MRRACTPELSFRHFYQMERRMMHALHHAGLGEEGGSAPQPRMLRPVAGAHFARVAAGATQSLGLTSGGQVYSWGEGSFGALGESSPVMRHHPSGTCLHMHCAMHHASGICRMLCDLLLDVKACYRRRCADWSRNAQLHAGWLAPCCCCALAGHGDVTNRARPALVQALWAEGIVSIAAGQYFSAAVSLSGQVWTWGRNKYGQLGTGSFGNALLPQPVRGVQRVVQVVSVDLVVMQKKITHTRICPGAPVLQGPLACTWRLQLSP